MVNYDNNNRGEIETLPLVTPSGRHCLLAASWGDVSTDGRVVLHRGSVSFRQSEVTLVHGTSGAGKTTLLNVLANNSQLSDTGANWGERTPIRVTHLPTSDVLPNHLRADEWLRYTGFATPSTTFHTILAAFGITPTIRACRLGVLSDGQRKRVMLAGALCEVPDLLLLDEPTSGLSSADTLKVMDCIRKASEDQQLAVVCVVHQAREDVVQSCPQHLLMRQGRIVIQGTYDQVTAALRDAKFELSTQSPASTWWCDCLGGLVTAPPDAWERLRPIAPALLAPLDTSNHARARLGTSARLVQQVPNHACARLCAYARLATQVYWGGRRPVGMLLVQHIVGMGVVTLASTGPDFAFGIETEFVQMWALYSMSGLIGVGSTAVCLEEIRCISALLQREKGHVLSRACVLRYTLVHAVITHLRCAAYLLPLVGAARILLPFDTFDASRTLQWWILLFFLHSTIVNVGTIVIQHSATFSSAWVVNVAVFNVLWGFSGLFVPLPDANSIARFIGVLNPVVYINDGLYTSEGIPTDNTPEGWTFTTYASIGLGYDVLSVLLLLLSSSLLPRWRQ